MSEVFEREIHIVDADSHFSLEGEKQFKVVDFWKWAFSDLVENTTRGILGEFIVGIALGLDMSKVKYNWGVCDLIQPDGTKIEVKTSAYLQTWNESKLSNIGFSRLKTRNQNGLDLRDKKDYNSDYYIFCIQTAKSHQEYNQFNLDKWQFKIVEKASLAKKNTDSISLNSLQKIAPDTFSFGSLREGLEKLKNATNKSIDKE